MVKKVAKRKTPSKKPNASTALRESTEPACEEDVFDLTLACLAPLRALSEDHSEPLYELGALSCVLYNCVAIAKSLLEAGKVDRAKALLEGLRAPRVAAEGAIDAEIRSAVALPVLDNAAVRSALAWADPIETAVHSAEVPEMAIRYARELEYLIWPSSKRLTLKDPNVRYIKLRSGTVGGVFAEDSEISRVDVNKLSRAIAHALSDPKYSGDGRARRRAALRVALRMHQFSSDAIKARVDALDANERQRAYEQRGKKKRAKSISAAE